MDAKNKVAQYLGYVSEEKRSLLSVKELPYVYWVHIKGSRPTFISKKNVERSLQLNIVGCETTGDIIVDDQKLDRLFIVKKNDNKEYIVSTVNDRNRRWQVSQILPVKLTDKPSSVLELVVFKVAACI